MLSRAKGRASAKRIPFDLCEDDIRIPSHCPALGIPLVKNLGGKVGNDNSPSLDRIVPHMGYVKGNIVVVSYKANRIKTDATPAELAKVAKFYNKLKRKKHSHTFDRR